MTIFFLSVAFKVCGQTIEEIKSKINKLKFIEDMPYLCESALGEVGCGDSLFWNVVMLKEKAIPYLIKKIQDTTNTNATVPNFGGQYTVGDVAFTALQEIVKGIPTFKLLSVKFDERGCGYCSYWQHLRRNRSNRKLFMQAIDNWYLSNKSKLVWVISNDVLTCDCSFKHPNGGHYEIKK